MRSIAILVLIINSTIGSCQIFEDMEIDGTRITPWIEENPEDYEGIYSFGISEYESKVTLAIEGECIALQVMSHEEYYLEDGTFGGWRNKFTTYTNARISGNRFYSNETNGEFVIYERKHGEFVKCLKLETPPFDVYDNKYELGERTYKKGEGLVQSTYLRTRFDIIPMKELSSMTPIDLKIMKNEIFARYGYIFKSGGQMDKYFSKQDWYEGINSNVNDQITCIEQRNIANILEVERVLGK